MKDAVTKTWVLPSVDGRRYSAGAPDPGGESFFFDDFNYSIARSATPTQLDTAFKAADWDGARAENGTGLDTSYLYTVSSIDGFSGTLPAGPRCLAMEAYPNNGNDPHFLQADYWLQYGAEGAPSVGAVPSDLWIQFWIYLQNHGSQQSRYPNRNKFIYPVADFYPGNSYPGTPEDPQVVTVPWLILLGAQGYEEDFGPLEENFLAVQAFGSDRGDGQDRLYQNLDNTKKLTANEWHCVRFHIDTSTANGVAEAWIRTQGDMSWTKVMEWIDGVTPGFSWTTYAETRAGMRTLRMPTTENANPTDNPLRDGDGTNYKFMQAFALAHTEADLPTY